MCKRCEYSACSPNLSRVSSPLGCPHAPLRSFLRCGAPSRVKRRAARLTDSPVATMRDPLPAVSHAGRHHITRTCNRRRRVNASPMLAMCPRACGAFFLLASANSFRIPVRADSPVFSPRRSESRSPLMLDFRNLFEGAIAGLRKDPSRESVDELRALDSAPRANVTSFLAEDVTTEPSAALQAFEAEGFVRVNRVLSHETATLLREYVDHTLEEKVEFESDEILDPGRYAHSFPAPSLCPSHSRLASAASGRLRPPANPNQVRPPANPNQVRPAAGPRAARTPRTRRAPRDGRAARRASTRRRC